MITGTDEKYMIDALSRLHLSCPRCGYDCNGIERLVCPECGVDVVVALSPLYATSSMYWFALAVLVLSIGAGGTLLTVSLLDSSIVESSLGAVLVITSLVLIPWWISGRRGFERLPTYKRQERFAVVFVFPLLLLVATLRSIF